MGHEDFRLFYIALTQGLVLGFCAAAMISPVNFMAVRRGIMGGFQKAFLVGVGAALVDATCAYAVFAGLAKVGFTGAWKVILLGICIIFLLYLAYGTLSEIRDNPEAMGNSKLRKQTQWIDNSFVIGFLLDATNPFTLIRWIGMVGALQLYQYETEGGIEMTGVAATTFFSAVLVSELVWFFFLGIAVHYSRNLFNRQVLKIITWTCVLLLLFYYLFMAIQVILNLIHTGGAPLPTH
jgi:threonine/homoserine/homoserine lactone efflux protein